MNHVVRLGYFATLPDTRFENFLCEPWHFEKEKILLNIKKNDSKVLDWKVISNKFFHKVHHSERISNESSGFIGFTSETLYDLSCVEGELISLKVSDGDFIQVFVLFVDIVEINSSQSAKASLFLFQTVSGLVFVSTESPISIPHHLYVKKSALINRLRSSECREDLLVFLVRKRMFVPMHKKKHKQTI